MKNFVDKVRLLLSFKNSFVFFFLIIICLLLAGNYRYRFYWSYPPIYDSFDEYFSVWLGQSLFNSGIPLSWSYHDYYAKGVPKGKTLELENFRITVNGLGPSMGTYKVFPKPLLLTKEIDFGNYKSHFNLVSPSLEQPPLGGIISAIPSLLKGEETLAKDIKQIRLPYVIYGVTSVLLVIWLSNLLFGRQVAVISGLIYASVPTVIISSRLALPENILVMFILLEVILLEMFKKQKKNVYFYLALIVAFLSPLIKLFGIAVVLTGIIYSFLVLKNNKKVVWFIVSGLLSVVVYFLYGFLIDKTTFLDGLTYQSQRFFSGPNLLLTKILIPKITKIFLDGWIFFGWVSVFILIFRKETRKYLALLIPFTSYLLVFLLFSGEDYGWYRLPLYPLMIIASGVIVYEMLVKPRVLPVMIFILTAVSSSLYWGAGIYDWGPYLNYFRLFVLVSLGLMIIFNLLPKKSKQLLGVGFVLILFVVSVYLNSQAINHLSKVWGRLGDKSSLIIQRP